MKKHWVIKATQYLEASLEPIPHEINEVDWKISLSENKERLLNHLIAFSNHPNGGFIIFGIENSSGHPVGITKEEISEIVNTLTNLGRDGIEPALILDHTVIEKGGVPLLCVHIPEQAHKPAHRRGKSIEESWLRSGGTTRKASRNEVGSLMLNSKTPRWEELRASNLLSADEIFTYLDLENICNLLGRPFPSTEIEKLQWSIDQHLIIPDGNGYYVTNFGGIAAAKRLSDFESLSRKTIRVIRYKGTNKVDTIDEIIGQKGYAVGFEGLITYLNRMLPHSEIIKQAFRSQVTVYPEIALRELIANALIHQDFSITGAGPTIELFDDRIEFTNPGGLLPSKRVDRLIGTTPESRNEQLASSFRQYRICEERGTGFQKTVAAVELYGMPPVLFTPMANAFKVTLYAPRKFSDMSHAERIEAAFQHACLQYYSSRTLTNTSLRERLKVGEKQRNQITNLIADAVTAGRIKRKDNNGGNKFAEYLPYYA